MCCIYPLIHLQHENRLHLNFLLWLFFWSEWRQNGTAEPRKRSGRVKRMKWKYRRNGAPGRLRGFLVSENFSGASSPEDVIFLFLYTLMRTVVMTTARLDNLHDFVFAKLFVFEFGYQRCFMHDFLLVKRSYGSALGANCPRLPDYAISLLWCSWIIVASVDLSP